MAYLQERMNANSQKVSRFSHEIDSELNLPKEKVTQKTNAIDHTCNRLGIHGIQSSLKVLQSSLHKDRTLRTSDAHFFDSLINDYCVRRCQATQKSLLANGRFPSTMIRPDLCLLKYCVHGKLLHQRMRKLQLFHQGTIRVTLCCYHRLQVELQCRQTKRERMFTQRVGSSCHPSTQLNPPGNPNVVLNNHY